MKRSKWLEKKGHAAETINVDGSIGAQRDGLPVYVIIHDAKGCDAHGFGKTEETAFADAHKSYTKARHRAALSVPGVSRG